MTEDQKTYYEKQIAHLEEKNKELVEDLEYVKTQNWNYRDYEKTMATLKSRLNHLQENLNEAQRELAKTSAHANKAEAQLSDIKKKNKSIQGKYLAQLNATKKSIGERDSLLAKCADLNKTLEASEDRVVRLVNERDKALIQAAIYEGRIKEANARLTDLEQQAGAYLRMKNWLVNLFSKKAAAA